MSTRRWMTTTAAMAAVAWALAALGTDPAAVRTALADPQGLVDGAGPDALVLAAVTAAAWLCWAWGAVGLLLTALSTTPGTAGRAASRLLHLLLPAGARRAAALAVGLGLVTAAPAVAWPAPTVVATVADTTDLGSPVSVDWPTAPGADRPAGTDVDWPAAPGADWPPSGDHPGDAADGPAGPTAPDVRSAQHVVLRGDCLWDIAAAWLARTSPGTPVTDAATATAVAAWWQANADVIGPDPDLLLPGQVLQAPPSEELR
ncbi:LysM peptidoglycan-binding domain-containing protein [Modestobacter sp. SYSU DS0657]